MTTITDDRSALQRPVVPCEPPAIELAVTAGPCASSVHILQPGRHILGRHQDVGIRIADRSIEPNHLVVTVDSSGTVHALQLAGRCPVVVGDRTLDRWQELGVGDVLEIGDSRIEVRASRPACAEPRIVEGGIVLRPPRVGPPVGTPRVSAPGELELKGYPGPVTLLSASLAGAGSVVLAMVMDRLMFAMFGLIGVVVAYSTWSFNAIGVFRKRRAARAAHDAAGDQFVAGVAAASQRSLAEHEQRMRLEWGDLWARRGIHDDAFVVGLGIGDMRIPLADGVVPMHHQHTVDRCELLVGVPLPAEIEGVMAITGSWSDAVARSLIVQLAVQTGPADWRLIVVSDEPAQWSWTKLLPHAEGVFGTDQLADAAATLRDDPAAGRRTVIVTDGAGPLTRRRSPLRQIIESPDTGDVATIVVGIAEPPACATSHLALLSRGRARWQAELGVEPTTLHAAGMSLDAATATAARMVDLVDPEALDQTGVPASVCVDDLEVESDWSDRDPPPVATIGIGESGPLTIDLVSDGPHALIAGTTGAGKSELLRTIVIQLATTNSPDALNFVLVDYKGGAAFDDLADLPHVVGMVTDLDAGLAERALVSLDAELRRRMTVMRDVGATDLAAYRLHSALPRLVVVIDEFAAMVHELPGFLDALVGIAQRGRSLGVHLILATQRPAGVVNDQIKANTNLRIALRLQDASDSSDVIGAKDAATLPRRLPGRGFAKFGPGELVQFQTARLTDAGHRVRQLCADAAGFGKPHRPWLPALGPELDLRGAPPGTIGVVDDPAGQRQPWLGLPTGNLAVVGALGSGATEALRTVAIAAARRSAPEEQHIYALANTTALDDLAQLDHVAAVVRLHEQERVDRLLLRLDTELDRRRRDQVEYPPIMLIVEGITAVRNQLSDRNGVQRFDRLLDDGIHLGLTVVASVDGVRGAHMVLPRFSERWVFGLDDPSDGPTVGVPAKRVPIGCPGRAFVVSTGLDVQVATPSLDDRKSTAGPVRHGVGPGPIVPLPAVIHSDDLADRMLGLDAITFDPIDVDVVLSPGRHMLVLGPRGSGRTQTLTLLVDRWRLAYPDSCVFEWNGTDDRAGAELAGAGLGAGDLVVVDNAERIADAPELSRRIDVDSGVTVVCAMRPDGASYGHWSAPLKRTGRSIVLSQSADNTGDAVGISIPRRSLVAPRPGLAWLGGDGDARLVQLATPDRPSVFVG